MIVIMAEYTSGGDKVHMCYSFEFLSKQAPTAARVAEVWDRVGSVIDDGWACWAFSNHDVVRHATRWDLCDAAQRCLTTLMMTMRGTACIYQGEELGLTEADVAFEDLQDPYGIEFWPEFKGRDGCRTPMVWQNSNRDAGFSEGKPWLPVASEHLGRAVEAQEDDEQAILHHYRRAIAMRRAEPTLAKGEQSPVTRQGSVALFTRTYDGVEILCAFNLGDAEAPVSLPKGDWQGIGSDLGGAAPDAGGLAPWQCLLARRVI